MQRRQLLRNNHNHNNKMELLRCNERLFQVDGDVDDDMDNENTLCSSCKQIQVNDDIKLRSPLKLAHMATVQCFRTLYPLDLNRIKSVWFSAFCHSIFNTSAQFYMIKFGQFKFTTASQLLKLICDLKTKCNPMGQYNGLLNSLPRVMPFCCCGGVKDCAEDTIWCARFLARIKHDYSFEDCTGHSRQICCCEGMYSPQCLNINYVEVSLMLHEYCWFNSDDVYCIV